MCVVVVGGGGVFCAWIESHKTCRSSFIDVNNRINTSHREVKVSDSRDKRAIGEKSDGTEGTDDGFEGKGVNEDEIESEIV